MSTLPISFSSSSPGRKKRKRRQQQVVGRNQETVIQLRFASAGERGDGWKERLPALLCPTASTFLYCQLLLPSPPFGAAASSPVISPTTSIDTSAWCSGYLLLLPVAAYLGRGWTLRPERAYEHEL
ncbi:hypothetical protein U9M48_030251 [Paspalum notatum var. saurae]|uniref:Uncharacterized protein n=1 Tax=Paspalum notatum var. saurae TaxID=547442 RepID=A0AAQ3U001_PASNO